MQVDLGVCGFNTVTTQAWLGEGEDRFTGVMHRALSASGGRVVFDVRGGSENDTLSFDTLASPDINAVDNVALGSDNQLSIFLAGQGGNDVLTCRFEGVMRGALSVNVRGGGGDDSIYSRLRLRDYNPWEVSDGYLDANLYGDAGNDYVNLALSEESPGRLHFVDGERPFIDGGADTDTYSFLTLGDVAVRGMERYHGLSLWPPP